MSKINVNTWEPEGSGTTITAGASGDTLAISADSVTGLNVGSDAAGDVLYNDGTDYTRLAKPGTPADEVLTFATGASAPSWVASAAGGKILQVVEQDATYAASTTTSYITTGLQLTITPSATTSKILLQLNGGECYNNTSTKYVYTTFYVDTGSGAAEVSPAGPYETFQMTSWDLNRSPHSATCVHSPATTSATTYYVYYKGNGGIAYWNQGATTRVWLTAMEIGI